MDEPLIQGNCGELCEYNCCRMVGKAGENLGIYLLPLEFEYMQKGKLKKYEIHHNDLYEMPPKIKKLYFTFCHEENGCIRNLRPVQCRTFPFEPHLYNDILSLVIEKNQIHTCPLIDQNELWRVEFTRGIYEGWKVLLDIPVIKYYIKHLSDARIQSNNISQQYTVTNPLSSIFKSMDLAVHVSLKTGFQCSE